MRLVPLLCLLVMSWSCRDPSTSLEDTEQADSTLSDLAGCSDAPSPFISVELSETEIATLPRLEWQSETPLTPTLILDPGDGNPVEIPGESEAATHGQFLALGTPALRSATVMLVDDTDSGRACSEELPFQTGLLSISIPENTFSSHDSDRAEGGYTLAVLMTEDQNFATILNEQGEYIWAYPIDGGPRMAMSLDRQSLVYLDTGGNATGVLTPTSIGTIVHLGFDGVVTQKLDITGMHTDFVELADGRFATLVWDLREFTDDEGATRLLVGDNLVIASPDGSTETIWSSLDHFDLNLERVSRQNVWDPAEAEDWSHANGLSYDPEVDAYFISLGALDAVVRVDGATGEQDWALSSTAGDFPFAAESVHGPHSIEHLGDDRLLIFNRNLSADGDLPDSSEKCSQASELELDVERGLVKEQWSYGSEECIWVLFYGEAQRLEGGNTMVIFSSAGQIDEVTPEGDTVWRVNTDVGGAFGFGQRVSSLQLDEVLER